MNQMVSYRNIQILRGKKLFKRPLKAEAQFNNQSYLAISIGEEVRIGPIGLHRNKNIQIPLLSRAGPQSQKWSDQQITLNPTGSIHKKARGKSLTRKKLILMKGFSFEN